VLFINLHGYDQARVQPGQALNALLRDLGVRGEYIPDGAEQRAGLYRSVLAQIEDPVLIIVDNASTEEQVRMLLPGPGPHRVMITSRHTLAGLGARQLDVPVLDRAAAVSLLDKVVRAARPDDDRISSQPDAAGRTAELCGGLPLALQITAALLAADPVLTAVELAGRLDDEAHRLDTLRYDVGSGSSVPSVAAAFELSYRQLGEDAARLFRLLPAAPGPDVSSAALAELADWPAERARDVIRRLARAHLLEPVGGGRDRWRMHDLLRAYAGQLPSATADEREQAFGRVLAWYLRYAAAADQHMRALAGEPVPAEFVSRDAALDWLDAERPGLIAAVTMAAGTGRHQEAVRLALSMSEYLERRRRFDDLMTVLAISRDAARRQGDRATVAAALSNLGGALRAARRSEEAISAYQDSAAIYRETKNQHGEGTSLNNLGLALEEVGRFEEAVSAHQDAAAISRKIGDRHAEGIALTNLDSALQKLRQVESTKAALQQALDSGNADAAAWEAANKLEVLLWGNVNSLRDILQRVIESGYPDAAPRAAFKLGYLLTLRDQEGAKAAYQRAIDFGHPHVSPMAAINLGSMLTAQGDIKGAKAAWSHVINSGDTYYAPKAAANLGFMLEQQGDVKGARAAYQLAKDFGDDDAAERLRNLLKRNRSTDTK
jgi:tetratricopeptide (TPR) repeat protein